MGRGWTLICTVAALLLAACQPSASDSGPQAQPSLDQTTAAATPFELPPPCALQVGGSVVMMDVREAVVLTGLAAAALADGHSPGQLARALPSEFDDRGTARALLGRDGPALTCNHGRAAPREQEPTASGLTPRAERLRRAIRRAFGPLPMGGFAAGGVTTGHVDGSSHYDGRAMDIFFRPHTDPDQARRGWALAHWLVARGARYDVLSVIYRDRIWTVWASFSGWREYVHPTGNRRNPVLRHLDHVHTAVEGGPWRGDD